MTFPSLFKNLRFWRPFLFFLSGGVFLCIVGWHLFRPQQVPELTAAEPAVRNIVNEVLIARQREIADQPDLTFGNDDEINILTLGIDSRKEGQEQHCDAIHLVTLNVKAWTIAITSVPRGTYSPLPPGRTYKETDYYLANACGFGGLEYGITQIEKVLGVKADYVATVGFSQALGIFRALDLPTTETLQWLRHRQTYQIGEPQRSQNQSTFMKDVALQLLQDKGISSPLLYLLYRLVDTNLTFDQIHALYIGYLASDIGNHPERITLAMKPYYKTEEYHFDFTNPDAHVDALVARLQGKLPAEDLSNKSLEEIQTALIAYLEDVLTDDAKTIETYEAQLWQQVEDVQKREETHYALLEKYVALKKEEEKAAMIDEVTNYILEMQFFELSDWEQEGRELLKGLVEEE